MRGPVAAIVTHGAGVQSVAARRFVARIVDGAVRVTFGQGAVMTMAGTGAAPWRAFAPPSGPAHAPSPRSA